MSLEDLAAHFATLSEEQAREHLDAYTLEQVREMWAADAFGFPAPDFLKKYLLDRITGK